MFVYRRRAYKILDFPAIFGILTNGLVFLDHCKGFLSKLQGPLQHYKFVFTNLIFVIAPHGPPQFIKSARRADHGHDSNIILKVKHL